MIVCERLSDDTNNNDDDDDAEREMLNMLYCREIISLAGGNKVMYKRA